MRLKPAILAVLTRGRLKKVIEHLGIRGVDTTSQNDMATCLNQEPRATASLLMKFLPEDDVPEVADLVDLPADTTFREFEQLAQRQDNEDSRKSPTDVRKPLSTGDGEGGQSDGHPTGTASDVVVGALVYWGPATQIGVVQKIEGKRATVRFDTGEERQFALDSGVVRRHNFKSTDLVQRIDGTIGVIMEEVPGQSVPTWKVWFGESMVNVAEMGLRPAIPTDPLERMRSGKLGSARDFNLRTVATDYWTAHQHNELVSLAHARVDLKPHQVSVVHRVISSYPHRFMLCDEVGLGKTIEAAMIIKELRARGQARRVLILVPPGLMRQWQFELKSKFNEPFAIYTQNTVKYLRDRGVTNPWTDSDSIITSHTWAAYSDDRRREINSVDWDMIVVDEAHHARIHKSGTSFTKTNLFRLVEDLVADKAFSRRAVLLVTATPLQLELYELYALVDMLNPVLFSSQQDFEKHIRDRAGLNQVVERLRNDGIPRDEGTRRQMTVDLVRYLDVPERDAARMVATETPDELERRLRARHRLSEVMIRNRKADTIGFQFRKAFRWEVDLSPIERQVQKLMQKVVDEGWRLQERTNQYAIGFLMVILQKLLASSARALLTSLRKRRSRVGGPNLARDPNELLDELEQDAEASTIIADVAPEVEREIRQIDEVTALLEKIEVDSKALVLLDQLDILFGEDPDGKVLIFTEFRETQDMLEELLSRRWSVHKFHGQLAPEQKDSAVSRFRQGRGPQILISTEAGGEGRNFQFCHHLVNYDLPWNPMRVEQRIGRLDRIGQEHPITIFNFHVRGTIEGRILEVLERRIRIFEQAVGSLDPILGEAETDIRKALRLAAQARDAEIDKIGERLEQEIQRAKKAEEELRDLIMQAKSYSAEIARVINRSKSPISQEEFELFLAELIKWAGAHVSPSKGASEQRVAFSAPFTLEHPELFGGQEVRRVCFDPRTDVDSEYVEYFGFGHPIVDALIRRVTQEKHEGSAAVRRVNGREVDLSRSGWQFNWIVRVGGLRPKEYLYSLFVGDDGQLDEDAGQRLVKHSRLFRTETSAVVPQLDLLDAAFRLAQGQVGNRKDRDLAAAQAEAADRAAIEEVRVNALFDHRRRSAEDRIEACRRTLQRLKASTDRQVLQAVPLWEANLARAKAELEAGEDDRQKALVEISRKRNPTAEFSLLNIARVEVI